MFVTEVPGFRHDVVYGYCVPEAEPDSPFSPSATNIESEDEIGSGARKERTEDNDHTALQKSSGS